MAAPLDCNKCPLCRGRTNVVNGRGNPDAPIVFIGEAPGNEEDLTGLPFQGRSGKLLDEAIERCGLKEGEYYVTNVVRCRPPENRKPAESEVRSCLPYLQSELYKGKPGYQRSIVTLGKYPIQSLIPATSKSSMAILFTLTPLFLDGMKIYPMYHPAYILRNYSKKDEWIERLQEIINDIRR